MSSFEFRSAGVTDRGLARQANEDAFLLCPDVGLFAVADGMGGHRGGQVASAAVIEALAAVPPAPTANALLEGAMGAIIQSNAHIHALGQAGGLMGTTVAVLLLSDRYFACLWAGDSRLYRLRGGSLDQLTQDHNLAAEAVAAGRLAADDAESSPDRNVLTRAVGVAPELEPGFARGEVEAGDVFLLCTDGLPKVATDAEVAAILGGADPDGAVAELLRLTLARGAPDNVALVVVAASRLPGADDPTVEIAP